jgi:hypothetical protein
MKTHRMSTVVRLLALGVLVAVGNVKAADVPALNGRFTLASVTRWGVATLPAGDYSFTLDKDYSGGVVTVFRGTQIVARIQAPGISDLKSGRSEMVMEGGAVRMLNLPSVGVSLHYLATHPGHHAAPKEPQLAVAIPVAVASMGR